MRKNLLSLLAIVAIAAWSCQDEKQFIGSETTPGDVVTLSLSPVLPANAGIKPLSSADGGATELDDATYDLRYILEVYDGATLVGTREVKYVDEYQSSASVTFEATLPAKQYQFVFWADFVNQGAQTDLTYKTDNTDGLRAIEWLTSDYTIGNNLRDAYYATETIDLSTPVGQSVTLHRPFGKLRILATDVKEYLTSNPTVNLGVAKLTYSDPTTFRKGFNALTGEPTTGTIALAAATCTPKLEASVSVAGKDFTNVYVLAFDYFFVPSDLSTVSFSIELFDDQSGSLASKTVANVPVGVNKLTTVLGNVFNPGASMDADIADAFGDPETTLISGSPVPIPHWLTNTLALDQATALSSATLTWTSENADSYEVEVNGSTSYSVTTNSKTLDNLPEATAYTWKVRAVKDSKTSEWSYTQAFQTPTVPFIDKMVGTWGASDAVINFKAAEGEALGLDVLMGRSHTTGAVSVDVVKGSLLINAVTGMNNHIGTGSGTTFDIDSQLANLSLAIDENTKTVSATKSFSSDNVYTKSGLKVRIGDISYMFGESVAQQISDYNLNSKNITGVTMKVTGVAVTGVLNAAGQSTWNFVYDVEITSVSHDIDAIIWGIMKSALKISNAAELIPKPQYLVSAVAMTK